jgi:hypothetical protein
MDTKTNTDMNPNTHTKHEKHLIAASIGRRPYCLVFGGARTGEQGRAAQYRILSWGMAPNVIQANIPNFW